MKYRLKKLVRYLLILILLKSQPLCRMPLKLGTDRDSENDPGQFRNGEIGDMIK